MGTDYPNAEKSARSLNPMHKFIGRSFANPNKKRSKHRDDSVRAIERTCDQFEVLPALQQLELAKRAKEGDRTSRDLLVKHSIRLVAAIARKHRAGEFVDRVQAGVVGVLRAVQTFNPRRGAVFSTYAVYCIKEEISRYIDLYRSLVHIPPQVHTELRKTKGAIRKLEFTLGREPSQEEISREARLPPERVNRFMELLRSVSNERIERESDDPEFEDPIEAIASGSIQDRPEYAAERIDFLQKLKARMIELSDRERLILKLRYPVTSTEALSLREIGNLLGISTKQVWKLETRALRKLKMSLDNQESV